MVGVALKNMREDGTQTVLLTQHSVEKTKERIGLSKKLTEKNAQKAYEHGLTHAECKAGLRRYVDKRFFINVNANNVRIYHHYVYIFCNQNLLRCFRFRTNFVIWRISCSGKRRRSDMQSQETDEGILMEDKCICCGGIVPEGYMVCHGCILEQNYKKKVKQWERKQFFAKVLQQVQKKFEYIRRNK